MLNATEEERREFHEVFRVKTAGMEGPPLHLSVGGEGGERRQLSIRCGE